MKTHPLRQLPQRLGSIRWSFRAACIWVFVTLFGALSAATAHAAEDPLGPLFDDEISNQQLRNAANEIGDVIRTVAAIAGVIFLVVFGLKLAQGKKKVWIPSLLAAIWLLMFAINPVGTLNQTIDFVTSPLPDQPATTSSGAGGQNA